MDRIDAFWDAARSLTYAELVEIGGALRDVFDEEYNTADARDWASLLDDCRQGYDRAAEEKANVAG